jgi:microcystin-dependent protein
MSAADQTPVGSLTGSGEAHNDFNYNPAPVIPPFVPVAAPPAPSPPAPVVTVPTPTNGVNSSFSPNVETFAGTGKSYYFLTGDAGGGGGGSDLTVNNLTVTNNGQVDGDLNVTGALNVTSDTNIGGVQIGGNAINIPSIGSSISVPVGEIYGNTMVEFLNSPVKYCMPPVGSIIMYAGDGLTLFEKYEFCDGQQRSKALFPDLYAVLGTKWGPETDTLFTFPNLNGRVAVGAGTLAGGGTYALGATGGAETRTLTLNDIPDHTHAVTGRYIVNLGSGDQQQTYDTSPGSAGFPTVGVQGRTGTTPVSLLQPYAVVNYVIRARV